MPDRNRPGTQPPCLGGKGDSMNAKAWSVLSNRKFFILWVSQAISRLGDSLFYIALLWYVQESTGSSLMLGFTGAAMMAPAVLGLVAGVMVDRWDRLKVMLVSDVARGFIDLAHCAARLSESIAVLAPASCHSALHGYC